MLDSNCGDQMKLSFQAHMAPLTLHAVTPQGLKALCLTLSLTVFSRSCNHINIYGGHQLYSLNFIKNT